jgi:AAA15 family ATPase/GTPase
MGRFLENIEIKNFKSIRHQVINDCRRINLFIGYPNVGKSNLLEALSIFSIKEMQPEFSSLVRLENGTTLFFNGDIEKPAEVIVDERHRLLANYSGEEILFGYQFSKPIDSDDWSPAPNQRDLGLFRVKEGKITGVSQFEILPERDRLPDIKKYDFVKRIHYSSGNFSVLKDPYGENIFEVVSSHESIRKEIAGLFKSYDLKFSFDKSTRTFKILKNVGEDIFLIPYSMIADTLQRVIFFKTAIQSNHATVLLFEEPEAHMFPPYISKFTGDIWSRKDNQYFIATHSPFVVNDFMENAREELAVYIVDYQNGETVVKRLTEEQVHEAYQYGLDLFFNVQSLME